MKGAFHNHDPDQADQGQQIASERIDDEVQDLRGRNPAPKVDAGLRIRRKWRFCRKRPASCASSFVEHAPLVAGR